MTADWCGTGSPCARIRAPGSASRAPTLKRNGSRARLSICASCRRTCSPRCRRRNPRAAMERQLAAAQREIDRVVDGVARGALSDAEVRARLVEPRRLRDEAQAALAAPAPKAIEVHPVALDRYRAAVNDLARTLSEQL